MCLVIMFTVCLTADTIVNGGVVSGSWTASGSPYLIQGDISIPVGSSLSIGPGVTVRFDGTYKLEVGGNLVCTGTADSLIRFTAQDTTAGWQSIRFSNTGGGINQPSSFHYTNFSYGRAIHGATGADPLNFGGAVWADNAGTLTFGNCTFLRCKSIQDGSAIYAKNNTNIIMRDCSLKQCESGFFGGVFVKNGTAQIENCYFLGNTANTFGAALYFYECPVANVISCVLGENTAGAVTGIYSFDSPLVVKNTLFFDNSTVTGLGGGMGVIYGTASVTNCTFVNNQSPLGGAAIWLNSLDAPAPLTNTIFWNNQTPVIQANSSTYTLSYCCTQSEEGDSTNIALCPLFANPDLDDYTLSNVSPCLDRGTPDTSGLGLPDLDLAGNPRISDGNADGTVRIDMGCYEFPEPLPMGTVSGTVTDGITPLAGAIITIGDLNVVSDAAGFYSVQLLPGNYTLTCSLTGYQSVTVENIAVFSDLTTNVDFVLNPVANHDFTASPELVWMDVYPNPFRHQVSLSLNLASKQTVTLEIYNLKGQKVRTLAANKQFADKTSIEWNGLDDTGVLVGRGIYFCRLNSDKTILTRKLVKM